MKRVARVLAGLLVAVALLVVVTAIVSRTPWFRQWLRDMAERQAEQALDAEMSIGSIGGSLLTGVRVRDVRIERDGVTIAAIPVAEIDYDFVNLLSGSVDIERVRLEDPVIHLRRTGQGRLNIATLASERTAQSSRPGQPRPPPAASAPARGWSIGQLVIEDGTLTLGDRLVDTGGVELPDRLEDLDAEIELASTAAQPGILLDIGRLSFRGSGDAVDVKNASGDVFFSSETLRFDDVSIALTSGSLAVDGTVQRDVRQEAGTPDQRPSLDLGLRGDDLPLGMLASLVPALEAYSLSPSFTAELTGPITALAVRFDVETGQGAVEADVVVDAIGPDRRVEGTIRGRDVNLRAFRGGRGEATDITMTATVDLQLPAADVDALTGTYNAIAPQLEYGYYQASDVRAKGSIDGRRVELAATADAFGGRASVRGSLRLPAGSEDLIYDLEGRLQGVEPSRLPMARTTSPKQPVSVATTGLEAPARLTSAIANQDVTLDFHVTGRGSDVEAQARIQDLAIAGAAFRAGTRFQVSRDGERLEYAARGVVHDLNLQRLGADLGITALTNPRFHSDINAQFDVSGAGTALTELTLHGCVTVIDSTLFEAGIPQMTIRPDLTRGSGEVAVAGRFASVDPGVLTRKPALSGSLNGTIDVVAALADLGTPVSVDDLQGSGRITLARSSLAGLTIESAAFTGSVDESLVRVESLIASGPDFGIRASGALALGRSGESALKYFVDSPPLSAFEALPASVRGEVVLEGTIAGNLAALRIGGSISGSELAYRSIGVLAVDGEFDLALPDLSLAAATGTTKLDATVLEIAGRTFPSVVAEATYARGAIVFDTVASTGRQSIDANGRLLWHDDHQEIHLRRFRFGTSDTRWSLAPGTEATVRYGHDRIAVDNLTLTGTAGGTIVVEGALGQADTPLQVRVANLELGAVDGLIVAEQGIAGRLDANALITGTPASPVVEARLRVVDGSYKAFQYDSLDGQVAYSTGVVRVDAQLQQDETGRLVATGTIPLSRDRGGALDLRVRSTPISLALVEAFTDEVTDVTGTFEADVRIAGSLAAPRPDGWLRVDDGAFTVALAQSRYSELNARIDLTTDVVNVRELVVSDDEGHRLRATGRLDVGGGEVRGLELAVAADDFEVMDNRFAELEVDADVQVSGTPTRPLVTGTLALANGQIHVDRILEVARQPYEIEPPAAGHVALTSPSKDQENQAVFAPTLSLALTIPDTLIVRATDLRVGGVPIGLGDLNVTIGGDLRIEQAPGVELALVGDIQTIRGTYEFQGRRFDIDRGGEVRFIGASQIDPRLDITATREISGVIANVHIGGALTSPELELSSQPPLDEAAILALVVFNRPLATLGAGEQVSLARRAAALASGFVTSALTESLANALEIDVLEIMTTSTEAGGLAPVLTIGEQFGQLFVKLSQQFGAEAVTRFVLEYRFTDWLRLQTTVAERDAAARRLFQRVEPGGVDLILRVPY